MVIVDWDEVTQGAASVGVDVGSLYVKVAAIDLHGRITAAVHQPHQGDPQPFVSGLEDHCARHSTRWGVTGSGAGSSPWSLDPVLCLHAGARHLQPSVSGILEIGATHFCLVRLKRNGDIRSIQTNPLCAAGTGSFLDAQAARMGLDPSTLQPSQTGQDPPSIATRCAVFAKSDLIHRQQEGFGIPDLWSGLCRGLAEGLLHALSQGSPLHGETLVCGGVALNPTVVAWLRSLIGRNGNGCSLHVSQRPEMTAAIGAGLLGRNGVAARARSAARPTPAARGRRAPLALVRSRPARFAPVSVATDDLQNEITVHRLPSGPPGEAPVFLGIDIGSTSTKLAFVDADGELLVDIYRRTQSDPILATRRLFGAALELFDRLGCVPRVAGAGTTGSGRKLVGELVAADVIVNEISAHVTAAVKVDPDVRTIFEIGGQDAKYMRIQAGRIVDANMNYVCAAGTGSFVEELSAKLGYRVEELGADVLGAAPPFINSRCTVFMEQDIHALLQEGVPRREAAGAIIYSVVENYLHRVVGNRPIAGDRIMFQGATARNIALTAAIEQLTGREVVVSPFPHAMGAYGVALLVRNAAADAPSSFRGLELASRQIEIARETCEGCHNRCELIRPVIAGEPRQRLWGMKCGREENGPARKLPTYTVFRKQRDQLPVRQAPAPRRAARGRIVMPLALSAYSLGPFWAEVFDRLGVELVPGPPTDAAIVQLGRKTSGSDFCLPVKVALGHVHRCLERFPADPLFLPHMIADRCVPGLTQTRFCPYLEVLPSLALGSLGDATAAAGRVIAPVMDLRLSDRKNARALADSLQPVVSLGVREVADALGHAHRVRRELLEEVRAAGQARWESVRSQGRPAVVVIGRPYNTLDAHLSQNLPREIAAAGVDVLPMDSLPYRPELLSGYFRNLFWASGQRILSALIQIAQTPGLYPVYLSNFGCGPDSFILSYAERVMGDKPLLILELDEHGSTGGYQTRLEAFLDVVATDNRNAPRAARAPDQEPPAEAPVPKNIRARRLYVPHMHPTGGRLLAAALRGEGYDACAMPVEDDAAFAEGRRWTRGSECLPAPLTLGSLLKRAEESRARGGDPNAELALFMPTSDGPCRFGQYCALDRMVLDRAGCPDLPILSPSSENAYFGIDTKVFDYILLADILFKLRCKLKPRERTRGDTEETLERTMRAAERAIESRSLRLRQFIPQAVEAFGRVPAGEAPPLLVGVVGEIYVRCHAFANSGLVDTIERLGGEVWLAPVSEWILYTAWVERYRLRRSGMSPWQAARLALRWQYMVRTEHAGYRLARPLLADRTEPSLDEVVARGRRFLPPDFEGESILTLGRAALFGRDGARLVVNCAPFGCMHGNITSALFTQAAEEIDVPVVAVSYDGVGNANATVETFVRSALARAAADRGRPAP